ncbi:MAG: septum site-determining protein MinD [Negativicutes bacterium]|nr:septum site-determining protein MinD [Negativicutes bacterium]
MGKIYAIVSGKGGTGKTTVTANLGAALAMQGKKVLLIDGDAGLRNLDLLLGLETEVSLDFSHVIQHICPAEKAILTVPYFPTLFFLAAAEKTTEFPVFETTELLRQLREQYDFILLDCPAGLGDFYRLATSQADAFICVTIPDIAAVQNARRTLQEAARHSSAEIYLIINRVQFQVMHRGEMLDIESICQIIPAMLLGIVPEDAGCTRAANQGELLVLSDQSAASQSFRRIARRLLGEKISFPRQEKQIQVRRGFFTQLIGLFHKESEFHE